MRRDIDFSKVREIELPRVAVPKAVTEAAQAVGLVKRPRSKVPFVAGALVTLGLVGWAVRSSPSLIARFRSAAEHRRTRGELEEELEDLAGNCPDYGYDCDGYSDNQSWCLYDLLESLPNPCTLFLDRPLCNGPVPSQDGIDNCGLQECFDMNTLESCVESLQILCDYAYTWG